MQGKFIKQLNMSYNMEINKWTINNFTVALKANTDLRILESLRDRVEQILEDTTWIKSPDKKDIEAMKNLLSEYNTKIDNIIK